MKTQKPQYFSGVVAGVTFSNPEKSFYIFRLRLDPSKEEEAQNLPPVTVAARGTVTGLRVEAGSWMGLEGVWETHPKYGRQVRITKAPVVTGGWTPGKIVRVLAVNGVGKVTMHGLRAKFQDELQDALEDRERLLEVSGINEAAAAHIQQCWNNAKALFQTMDTLAGLDISGKTVDLVWSTYGDEAQEVLTRDPWRMVEIPGISFAKADSIAHKLKCDLGSLCRVEGAASYCLMQAKNSGSTFAPAPDLYGQVKYLLPEVTPQRFAEALKSLKKRGKAVVDKAFGKAVYEPRMYELEQDSASMLAGRLGSEIFKSEEWKALHTKRLGSVTAEATEFAEANPQDMEGVARKALAGWLQHGKASLTEQQLQGALNALTQPVSILTGGPGTGKTFTLKTVVKVLQEAGISMLLTAPTGIAAKRVQQVTGAEAFTIHRAFQAKGESEDEAREVTYAGVTGGSAVLSASDTEGAWGFDVEVSHPAEVLVVDETSMVDQHLMYRLLSCTNAKCRIVFVGDDAQLPSVGAGNVLRDLIDSGKVPTTKLTEIFRQEDTSDIVIAAHDINSGVYPKPSEGKTDYVFKEEDNDSQILSYVLKTAQKLYTEGRNFQVLSPKHRGTLGVTNLNDHMRTLLNPASPSLREMNVAGGVLREGDRIMVVKNDYNYNIFNGDVGKVLTLDLKDKVIELKIWGPPDTIVRMAMKDASRFLRLAYAITVHKCLAPGTLVETGEGVQPIEEVAPEGLIATPTGMKPYRNKVSNPEGRLVTLTTTHGKVLTTTPDHGIQALRGTEWQRVQVGELELGSVVLHEEGPQTVQALEEGWGPSYCVEVPDGNQFLQNGFHGWNCQGQEYDYIVMPWVDGFRHQLQRNLVYTAITRAKKKVVLFGQQSAMRKSVDSIEASERRTNFPQRILKELAQDEPTPLINGRSAEEYQAENPNL